MNCVTNPTGVPGPGLQRVRRRQRALRLGRLPRQGLLVRIAQLLRTKLSVCGFWLIL